MESEEKNVCKASPDPKAGELILMAIWSSINLLWVLPVCVRKPENPYGSKNRKCCSKLNPQTCSPLFAHTALHNIP